jgi:hypothetical protein
MRDTSDVRSGGFYIYIVAQLDRYPEAGDSER